MIQAERLERVVEIELDPSSGALQGRWRVEIFSKRTPSQDMRHFSARVFRYDIFRLKSLPVASDDATAPEFADSEIQVVDSLFDGVVFAAIDADDALTRVLDALGQRLLVQIAV